MREYEGNKWSYTWNPAGRQTTVKTTYRKAELERMTTYQLREICRKEKLINGIFAPLDKEELLYQILRFRGQRETLWMEQYEPEGWKRLETLLSSTRIQVKSESIKGCAKLVAYEGLAITPFDQFTIGYHPALLDTNALLVSGEQLCAVFQLRADPGNTKDLYLTKTREMPCRETNRRDAMLYCLEAAQSDLLYRIYLGKSTRMPEHLSVFAVPIMQVQVRKVLESKMPLAIDFGTSNTTAGLYLDAGYLEQLEGDPIKERLQKDTIHYVTYREEKEGEIRLTPLLPTVVGVVQTEEETTEYVFGQEADTWFRQGHLEEGFCVFYDLKRWVRDPDRLEELVDRRGQRRFVARKEILKSYLEYVIQCATERFKCHFSGLHLSAPVKQKALFSRLFQELFPSYTLEEMLDEGVAVLYNTISEVLERGNYQERAWYQALILDCGGGTTDLSSCRFSLENQRVSYQISLAASYENGDTNFGGNNLTYRILQWWKVALAHAYCPDQIESPEKILEAFSDDLYQQVEEKGAKAVYAPLEAAYEQAEAVLPTRFLEYEQHSKQEYYAVKNNFYFLFHTAERFKQLFFQTQEVVRLALSTTEILEAATKTLCLERFRVAVRTKEGLLPQKDLPPVFLSLRQVEQLLRADIYGLVARFLQPLYETGELQDYSILRLTGQSCRIGLFREALKEFIPGKVIASGRRESREQAVSKNAFKLACLEGAIKYLRDTKFGYAKVIFAPRKALFPYQITAKTHAGEEKVLLAHLDRSRVLGSVSRNRTELLFELQLKNAEGAVQYTYSCQVPQESFRPVQPQDVVKAYDDRIPQGEVDAIVEQELKFFVLAEEERWGFLVIPVQRKEGQLEQGREQFFLFETEGWVANFFDGLH